MDLTVCTTRRQRLIITDRALVVIVTLTEDEARAQTAQYFFGHGLLGAAIGGDGGSLLSEGGILNLGDGQPVPSFDQINKVLTCFAAEVPEELSTSRRWPKVLPHRRVTFYPRPLISEVTLGWLGALRAKVAGQVNDLEMHIDILEVWKARGALRRWAYPLS